MTRKTKKLIENSAPYYKLVLIVLLSISIVFLNVKYPSIANFLMTNVHLC